MLSGYSTHSNPHIPAGFRESRVTPVDSAPLSLPQPRGIAQGTAGTLKGFGGSSKRGWRAVDV